MKKFIAIALLAVPGASFADHLDVIEMKLNQGCSLASYLAVVKDFNEWGKGYGYKAEILVPLQRANLETMFWVGRSASTESFGKAWDAWRDAQTNPDSVAAKLNARLDACGTSINRSGMDTY
jgi:hypothetical protein